MNRQRLFTLLVVLALLAGCSGVPTSGPVERVHATPGRLNPGVVIAPAPPGRNASPITVVEGFLHAMASSQPDYRVARTYLTPDAATAWEPQAGVRVYAEGNPVVASEEGAVLRAPVVGTLDPAGAYRQSMEMIDHDFGLVQDAEGQWRIGSPPAGLLISEYLFSSAFTRVTPYFWGPGARWLVPDPRYFPRGPGAYDGAAEAVIGGATGWLARSVEPPLAGVALEQVVVSSAGVAEIQLRRLGDDLTGADRVALATQLAWSYRSFESVVAITVRWVGEDPWAVDPYGTTIPVGGFPEADPTARQGSRQLFALAGGQIVRVVEGTRGIERLPVAPGASAASHAAVRLDALVAAAVSADRSTLELTPLGEAVVTTVGTSVGLRRPQFDRQGDLWVNNDAGEVGRVPDGGSWTPVRVDGLGDARISTFRLAPDGVRVALVVVRPGGQQVMGLARVVRDDDAGVSIEGWRELHVATTSVAQLTPLDVGWRAADSLLVLVNDGRTTTVQAVAQDGATIVPIGPTEADDLVELAVAPGAPPMVRAAGGQVWRYNRDLRWSQHDVDLASVFYP